MSKVFRRSLILKIKVLKIQKLFLGENFFCVLNRLEGDVAMHSLCASREDLSLPWEDKTCPFLLSSILTSCLGILKDHGSKCQIAARCQSFSSEKQKQIVLMMKFLWYPCWKEKSIFESNAPPGFFSICMQSHDPHFYRDLLNISSILCISRHTPLEYIKAALEKFWPFIST